jgi:phosphoribosylanthranilate isomerase
MLSNAKIADIASHAHPAVSTFLLTSQVTAAAISAHIRATRPTAVQIVCPIDPLEAGKLAVLEPQVTRVQVVHVEGPEALNLISAYAPCVDAFLLDSGRPTASIPVLGGTGKTHDWGLAPTLPEPAQSPFSWLEASAPPMSKKQSGGCVLTGSTCAQASDQTVCSTLSN